MRLKSDDNSHSSPLIAVPSGDYHRFRECVFHDLVEIHGFHARQAVA
jgi:hypothetical protein